MNNSMLPPTLEAIETLDGRIFVTLDSTELRVLEFYRAQGRKFDVAVFIENKADAAELAVATTRAHADVIMKRANSMVNVEVGTGAEVAWAART